ncbi:MAG: hypothetical protein ACXADY_24270 [Candidatus Hodarchaeales archaeon]|jgi:hypothetical protein
MWKHTLGKPGSTYIVGKRWIKKNIPKSKRITKTLHKEPCSGDIYDIGIHYLPDDTSKPKQLWVCMTTGELLKKEPVLIIKPKPKVKKTKPKPMMAKPPTKVEKKVKPVVEKPSPIPEPVTESIEPAPTTINTLTPVSEVKGIGKAAYEKLSAANVKTIGDLISKHSQDIATLIGRKSDTQIKKWQENAKDMLM